MSRDQLERIPPTDVEAEWAVVASLCLNGETLEEITSLIGEDDFFDHHAKLCFAEAVDFRRKGKRFDAALLWNKVKKRFPAEDIEVDYLKEKLNSVPSGQHAEYYAGVVLDCSIRRALIQRCNEVMRSAYDHATDPVDVSNKLIHDVSKLQLRVSRTAAHSMADIMQEVLTRQADRLENRGSIGIPSGFEDIDQLTSGLPNELIVLAARPSVGKTALAIQIAVNVAKQDKEVLFASLEMTTMEIADRILSWKSNVSLHNMRNGFLTGEQRRAIVERVNEFSQLPLNIVDASQVSVTEIMAHALRAKRRGNLGLIVIDYLELIQPTRREQIREREVAEICAGLKRLQKDTSVPVVCLAQLNRDVEKGADRDPKLSDLRSSGSIEQDAHQVWFLARKILEANPGDNRVAKLIVAKNRNGQTGSTRLKFTPETSSFSAMDYGDGQQRAF